MSDNGSMTTSVFDSLAAELLARRSGESPQLRKLGIGLPCPWENDPEEWLSHLFPEAVFAGFGPHHREVWAWTWALQRRVRPRPLVTIWPRGGGKSSTAELACIAAGALGKRRYALYVSATQELADKHVSDIARRLELESVERYYPALASREVSKYGISRGWSGSRLRTAAGFMVDAIGLNAAVRGLKVGDSRPDLIILDDIDHLRDSLATVDDKIATITQSILPAGSTDLAVLAPQNLIHPDSIFSRLAGVSEHSIDMLADRIVSGPYPAIIDMVTEQQGNRTVIVSGTPLWAGQGIKECQDAIDTYGVAAFRRESQQEVEAPPGGMFDHITFQHCTHDDVPDLVRKLVTVDPSVTDTDESDSHGVCVGGVDEHDHVYYLFSWEQRASPEKALALAVWKAIEYGADTVIVETNQGGDTWRVVYEKLMNDFRTTGVEVQGVLRKLPEGTRIPAYDEVKASSSTGSKTERAGPLLLAHERHAVTHVRGTHDVLEKALRRFPRTKPFDLTDSAVWLWHKLVNSDDLPFARYRQDPEFRAAIQKPATPADDPVAARIAAYQAQFGP